MPTVSRENCFAKQAPRSGNEAHDAMDFNLERFLHLYAMNRGILLTPFTPWPSCLRKQRPQTWTATRKSSAALYKNW
jgi:hypothetical protein